MLAQLFELAVGHVFFDPQMTADPLKKLDHLCRLPLCEKIDLQIEMAALIGLRAHPVLTDQHEGREQHRFERQDHRQERERKRIKNREPPYEPAIGPDPRCNPGNLDDDESIRAGELPDGFRQATVRRDTLFLFGLEPNDRLYVVLMKL